jgi:glycosyltransferase involved in cell wall biosynthesis
MMFSVLLSVYKSENSDYLDQALFSIWDEQLLRPSQIVIVKDGPLSVELLTVLDRWLIYLPSIITIVPLPTNVGLGAALNEGLKHCQYDLIARMDSDDIALPERFKVQVSFMVSYPDVAASSAQLEEWDTSLSKCIGKRHLPLDSISLVNFAKRRSPLSHPLAILRKNIILSLGGYPPLRKAQDYALLSLMIEKGYKLENVPETLLKMRTGNELFGRRGWGYFKEELQLLKYQRKIGFLSQWNYFINVFLKAVLRLSPDFIKAIAYRIAR